MAKSSGQPTSCINTSNNFGDHLQFTNYGPTKSNPLISKRKALFINYNCNQLLPNKLINNSDLAIYFWVKTYVTKLRFKCDFHSEIFTITITAPLTAAPKDFLLKHVSICFLSVDPVLGSHSFRTHIFDYVISIVSRGTSLLFSSSGTWWQTWHDLLQNKCFF